ncbi:KamA family protein [Sphaerochaeta pleomorpha str. Grapes]|uniref:KamA family protein n=1 Tax=Sphaerochaeta pleomorpha (strain ATCC BAA-1885 / DSM 22778 / Grapes) TaxID=158190 RepID=G8QSP6_SPHPG|nr:KamA family radical SAM protein [Sphaerochaeta pleomorpha]AEV29007.1 KamA family protein [Sphaerochaeta pleomorpha str. Grapes]
MEQEKQDHTIRSMAKLGSLLTLSEDEKTFQEGKQALPVAINPYFFNLIDPKDPKDPLRRQVVPTRFEQIENRGEDIDPLEEIDHSITERLIHRYENRVAFLVTDICPLYCRHCFRRRFTGTFNGPATRRQIEEAAEYIQQHPKVKEILLTGGDMMTLSDSRIDEMVTIFRTARPDLIIRLCTRTPATWPQRITDDLIAIFKKHSTAPFYVMTQFNHPRELTEEAKIAISRFVDAGIPAMNQTVLLRGVNDSVDTLEELCNKLLANRVKPYYLFQGDLVSGTAHFRVPLIRGMEIEEELHRRLSGLAMPSYTVDLPEGGGKVPLAKCYIEGNDGQGTWKIRTPEGGVRYYQDPPSGD